MHSQPQKDAPQAEGGEEKEGLVVWDQKGVVIVWPDGHCSRFSWAALRAACYCPDCRKQHNDQDPSGEVLL